MIFKDQYSEIFVQKNSNIRRIFGFENCHESNMNINIRRKIFEYSFVHCYKSLKHRASLQSATFYVILENFSFLRYKLFENIRIFKYSNILNYSNIFYSTSSTRYLIRTIWLRQIIFDSDQNKYSFVHWYKLL